MISIFPERDGGGGVRMLAIKNMASVCRRVLIQYFFVFLFSLRMESPL